MKSLKVLAVVGLAVVLTSWLSGTPVALGQGPGDATVKIEVQVNEQGNITSATVKPKTAVIRGASKDGALDGGRVTWEITGTRQATGVTVTIKFEPQTPFRASTFEIGNVVIKPDTANSLDSGPANVTRGRFPYTVKIVQGGTTIEADPEVQISQLPTLTEWGLIALAVLLMGGMGYMLYRRRPALRPAAP